MSASIDSLFVAYPIARSILTSLRITDVCDASVRTIVPTWCRKIGLNPQKYLSIIFSDPDATLTLIQNTNCMLRSATLEKYVTNNISFCDSNTIIVDNRIVFLLIYTGKRESLFTVKQAQTNVSIITRYALEYEHTRATWNQTIIGPIKIPVLSFMTRLGYEIKVLFLIENESNSCDVMPGCTLLSEGYLFSKPHTKTLTEQTICIRSIIYFTSDDEDKHISSVIFDFQCKHLLNIVKSDSADVLSKVSDNYSLIPFY